MLTRSTPIELVIEHMNCPAISPQHLSIFLCQSGFIGNLRIGSMIFKNSTTEEALILQSILCSIQGENFSDVINLQAKGSILASNIPFTEQAGFSFEGQMIHFWTPEGKFNRKGLSVKGELAFDLLPVREITGIIPMDEQVRHVIQAVLGDHMNARIEGEISQLTGPLTIDIKASNFKAIFPLQLHENGITLRDYVDAEIALTEAVNETLLKDIAPLFITGAYSNHPIKAKIDPEGFFIPLRPFSLRGIQIEKAKFDLGKIHVHNGGQIQSLMEFLKAKEVSPDGSMDAWFTPIFVSLKDGVASYQRFDLLLAGSVHIAFWGKIDLNKDKVRMTMGIAPSTLQQRFNIKGLSQKDLFQVKMRGSTANLELDWSSAYTRIGLIIARSAGGHIGYIVGGIVESIVTAFGEEPAPPPTTVPFPWQVPALSEQNIVE